MEGKIVNREKNMKRLRRQKGEIGIEMKMREEEIVKIEREMIRRKKMKEGMVYIKVKRGKGGERDFVKEEKMKNQVVILKKEEKMIEKKEIKKGENVI